MEHPLMTTGCHRSFGGRVTRIRWPTTFPGGFARGVGLAWMRMKDEPLGLIAEMLSGLSLFDGGVWARKSFSTGRLGGCGLGRVGWF